MDERTWSTVDKSEWPRGEWTSEPDKVQFLTASGLPGLIVRGPTGALCGYVGAAESHPLFNVRYDGCPVRCGGDRYARGGEKKCIHDAPDSSLSVHGGLTFSDFCQPGAEEHGVCHVPGEGEPDHVWWFGFDCAHSGDLTPLCDYTFGGHADYRSIGYVRTEVESLARQLSQVGSVTAVASLRDYVAESLSENPELIRSRMKQHAEIVASLRDERDKLQLDKNRLVHEAQERDSILLNAVVDLPSGPKTLHQLFEDAGLEEFKFTRPLCSLCLDVDCLPRDHEVRNA